MTLNKCSIERNLYRAGSRGGGLRQSLIVLILFSLIERKRKKSWRRCGEGLEGIN